MWKGKYSDNKSTMIAAQHYYFTCTTPCSLTIISFTVGIDGLCWCKEIILKATVGIFQGILVLRSAF